MSRSSEFSRSLVALALVSALSSIWTGGLRAQDFRIDTDVYLGDDEETFSEHLTLFHGSVVYDFAIKGSDEITIFKLQDGEIILLDVKRRRKTALKTAVLLDFSAHIKAIGTNKKGEDLVAPKFETTFDAEQNSIELISRKITYLATGVAPANPAIATRYREFTDWYARLNSMLAPNPPHFGRLELNRALAERGLVALDIQRSVDRGLFSKPLKARSHHVIHTTISGTDRRRIDEAGGYLADFTEVSLVDYLQPATVASR